MTTYDINKKTNDANHMNAYDVTCLRQDHAITVRLPSLCERASSVSHRRSKRLVHAQVTTGGFWCLSTSCREKSSNTFDQLPCKSATRESTKRARAEGLCCCNYSKGGSLVSSSIRQRLSSLIPHSRAFHLTSALPKIKDFLHVLFFLVLMSKISSTHAMSSSSTPLTRTDVTTDKKFGVFMGKGPPSHSSHKRSTHPGNYPLDFQALKVIPDWDGTKDVLLLSGRDYIYMINASVIPRNGDLRYNELLQWSSQPDRSSDCRAMGKSKFECNNFIQVMELHQDNKLYVCGTNSYHPKCRYYSKRNFKGRISADGSSFLEDNLCVRQCPCPYNPTKPSATLYSNTSNQLFSATLDNFVANVPVFMRNSDPPLYSIDKWFNDPTFIKMVEAKNGKIYLFFRETANSVETGKDPATYGRIAQVCINDRGGTTVLEGIWTSFLKARLKCAISGSMNEATFTFDNLTSVSDITTVTGSDGRPKDVIFATFTTPWNWRAFSMSAVCVYSMEDIESLFDSGRFLSERTLHMEPDAPSSIGSVMKAVPVSNWEVPVPRPGKCLNETVSLTDKTLHFAKEHFLMYDSVTPWNEEPLFITEKNIQATQIVVDNRDGQEGIVAYVGTESGKILRIRPNFRRQDAPKALLLEEMNVAENCDSDNPCGVLALSIYRPTVANSEAALFVAFTDRLVRVPLTTCSQYVNAECCNVDPVCGWIEDNCLPRSSRVSASFPATSPVKKIRDNYCQSPENRSECDIISLISTLPELCPDTAVQPKPERPRQNGVRQLSNSEDSILLRSIGGGRPAHAAKNRINHQPISPAAGRGGGGRRCENVREGRIPKIRNVDDDLAELFIQHVLPSISSEFSDTIRSLPDEDRQAILLQQLRDAMVDTARLVLKNHRKDHCLPTKSINSLTHSYPLLLREIEIWHNLAIRKMIPDKRWACWQSTPSSNCTSRLSFSIPLAPTLWAPLANLIKDFGGKCDAISSPEEGGSSGGCQVLPGVLPCKDKRTANSSLCQIRKCQFSEYAVDVRAFFRHANDSRKFLPADSSVGPFEKVVVRKINGHRTLRSLLKLSLSRKEPFQVYYIPATEKVKITFHYAHAALNTREVAPAVRERPSRRSGTDESSDGCNVQLETKLNTWFDYFMSHLKPGLRNCQRQIDKANHEIPLRVPHSRKKRSYEDNRPFVAPRKCYYAKKTFDFPQKFWNSLVERAVNTGGQYLEDQKSILFTNRNEVVQFFNKRCPGSSEREESYQNMQQSIYKKRKGSRPGKWVKAEVKVSSVTPFRIEQLKSDRVRLKYFAGQAR